jgi:TPR repeat protein
MAQIALETGSAQAGSTTLEPQQLVALYLKAADQGYAEAQTALGQIYDNGLGVEHDSEKALKWYTQAADQGEAEAMHWLAANYLNGDNAPQSMQKAIGAYAKAAELYGKAAEANFPLSQLNLGMMYLTGQGVESNEERAFALIQKAASQGLPAAQTQLASMYEVGQVRSRAGLCAGLHASVSLVLQSCCCRRPGSSTLRPESGATLVGLIRLLTQLLGIRSARVLVMSASSGRRFCQVLQIAAPSMGCGTTRQFHPVADSETPLFHRGSRPDTPSSEAPSLVNAAPLWVIRHRHR